SAATGSLVSLSRQSNEQSIERITYEDQKLHKLRSRSSLLRSRLLKSSPKDKTNMKTKTMNALKFSGPFKNAFCRSSRGNEAHFLQDISNDSRASLHRLLLFQHPVSAVLAFLIFAEVGRADPLDTWTWRNPLPTGNYLNGITYGNDQFVVVGDLGTIVTSADGTN